MNCPRRLIPLYSDLEKELNGSRPIEVRVTGAGWGMASNSIHFLDMIQFLAAEPGEIRFCDSRLNPPFPAKRAGFVELSGYVNGSFGPAVHFSLASYSDGDAPLMVTIDTPALRCIIVETGSKLVGWKATGSGTGHGMPSPPKPAFRVN